MFLDIFVLMFPYENLSHYLILIAPIGSQIKLNESDKNFREKRIVQMASTFSSRTFLLNFFLSF